MGHFGDKMDTIGTWTRRNRRSVMRWFIEKSPITLRTVKLSLPVMLGFVLWKRQETSNKFVTCSLGLLLVVYSVVILLHIYWVIAIWTG